jgi:hypothetical protein
MPRVSEAVSALSLEGPGEEIDDSAMPPPPPYEDPLRAPLLASPHHRRRGDEEAAVSSPTATGAANHPSLRSRRQSRVLDRDAAFAQSRGRWRVQNLSREATRLQTLNTGRQRRQALSKRIWDDWFYSLAYQRTVVLWMILFLSYGGIVVMFAFVYLGVSFLGQENHVNPDGSISKQPFCDMDIHDHMEALYFSLSTMTTIGYGVSDYYFGGCWTPLLLVLAQVCCAITFDAVAIGLLFQRLSRGHKRGKTILFSDHAVIQRVKGQLYFQCRVGELRHHQLREASVKAYCLRHERCWVTRSDGSRRLETTHFVTRPLRLQHERVSPHVLMSLPQVLVHGIQGKEDFESPLCQPLEWYDEDGIQHKKTCLSEDASLDERITFWTNETKETMRFWQDRRIEVILLVEGTDELTGAAIQARHSYQAKDIQWHHALVPCVLPYTEELSTGVRRNTWYRQRTPPTCVVDFAAFHDTQSVVDNLEASPYIY